MAKGSFLDDIFEKALEAGHSMAKSGGKQLKQTFNPIDILKNTFSQDSESQEQQKEMQQMKEKMGNKATPLDFAKLQEKYTKQDNQKAKILANRLFQLVKQGEEKVKTDKERETQEKKRTEIWEVQQKKQEKQKQQQTEQTEMPQGKERKSILGGKKKKATPDTAELRPSKGKQ